MDRPALTRLLRAVEAGELDCVVVYKVDRLSRSLLDFTRMLSVFEKHKVSFAAVTQQFNTSTSLGRLTLNILLSFAQFERELIGERTRDKMSAARKKGKWTGGYPLLGYDIVPGGGRLVINEAEAAQVRAIFAMFETYGSVPLTLQEIERRGWRLKSWTTKAGRCHPGGPFAMNSLRRILANIIYTGSIQHHGKPYPGEHAAILEPGTWERVQALMAQGPAITRGRARNKHLALLNGLLFCESCAARMVYTYAMKNGRKYPYYLCLNAQRKGWAECPAKSLPAHAIEESVPPGRMSSSFINLKPCRSTAPKYRARIVPLRKLKISNDSRGDAYANESQDEGGYTQKSARRLSDRLFDSFLGGGFGDRSVGRLGPQSK
jgi:site-specific DNA recombinase